MYIYNLTHITSYKEQILINPNSVIYNIFLMLYQSFVKSSIYSISGLMIFFGLLLGISFIVLGCGRFTEATGSKNLLISTGIVFSISMLIVAGVGIVGTRTKSILLLLIFAGLGGLIFFTFWISFAYLKKGKSRSRTKV